MKKIILSHFEKLNPFRKLSSIFDEESFMIYFRKDDRRLDLAETSFYREDRCLERGTYDPPEAIKAVYMNNHPVGLAILSSEDFFDLSSDKIFKFYTSDGEERGFSMSFDDKGNKNSILKSFNKKIDVNYVFRDGKIQISLIIIIYENSEDKFWIEYEFEYDYQKMEKVFTKVIYSDFNEQIYAYKIITNLRNSEKLEEKIQTSQHGKTFTAFYENGKVIKEELDERKIGFI